MNPVTPQPVKLEEHEVEILRFAYQIKQDPVTALIKVSDIHGILQETGIVVLKVALEEAIKDEVPEYVTGTTPAESGEPSTRENFEPAADDEIAYQDNPEIVNPVGTRPSIASNKPPTTASSNYSNNAEMHLIQPRKTIMTDPSLNFETLLKIYKKMVHDQPDSEMLIHAIKSLMPEGKRFVPAKYMKEILLNYGDKMSMEEVDEFLQDMDEFGGGELDPSMISNKLINSFREGKDEEAKDKGGKKTKKPGSGKKVANGKNL